jgi:Ca2+-binding EF-hand superfamily protein
MFVPTDMANSGNLDMHEFQRALAMLGTWSNPHVCFVALSCCIDVFLQDMHNIFYLIDQDRSGRVNEREFCEYVSLFA